MDRNTWLKNSTNRRRDPKNYYHDDRPRRKTSFDPDHGDVARAVDNFLAGGGEITKIEEVKESVYIYGHTSSSFFDDEEL